VKVLLRFLLRLFLNQPQLTFKRILHAFLRWVVEGVSLEAELLELDMQLLPFFDLSQLVGANTGEGDQDFFPEIVF